MRVLRWIQSIIEDATTALVQYIDALTARLEEQRALFRGQDETEYRAETPKEL